MKQIIIIALLAALFGASAYAGGEKTFTPIDPQKLIQPCWDISKKDLEGGSEAAARVGAMKTAKCLEKVILNQSGIMFGQKKNSKQEIQKRLDMASVGIQKMYWSIYNQHKGCPDYCGSYTHSLHVLAYAHILDDMIKTMVMQRNDAQY